MNVTENRDLNGNAFRYFLDRSTVLAVSLEGRSCDGESALDDGEAEVFRQLERSDGSTVQSYVIAETNAIVLPTSNAHHAQPSPRRKAVAARRST